MPQAIRDSYEQLYQTYTARDDRFQGADQRDIREVCNQVRTWSAIPEQIDPEAVHTLILAVDNGVANVNQGNIQMRRGQGTANPMDETDFHPILCEMLQQVSVSKPITRDQYLRWQQGFFSCVGFRARLVFNRLVFTCFPTQFCSVVDVGRLRLVMDELGRQGLLAPFLVTKGDNAEWFDLCQHVVPVIHEAFPTRDYADHSTFLAAMGDALN